MPVYFARAGRSGPVKIGYAKTSVAHRMAELQDLNHEELHLIRILTANGMTLDRLSAHAARHVVEGVGKIAREALDPCDGGTR